MNRYVIADAGGEIVRTVTCLDEFAAIQAQAGETILESAYASVATHCVLAGALFAYTSAQAAAKLMRPTWAIGWDNAAMAWIDPRTLAQAKLDRWEDIKAERDARIVTPKTTRVGTFDADLPSQENLNKVIALVQIAQAKGLPATSNYTLADNTRPNFNLAQLEQAALEMGSQIQGLYDTAYGLRQQINAATTAFEVAAVAWPA